jgi:hypothetical protein
MGKIWAENWQRMGKMGENGQKIGRKWTKIGQFWAENG